MDYDTSHVLSLILLFALAFPGLFIFIIFVLTTVLIVTYQHEH